jgi:aromatic ring-opening dioxygenase catalytic subunit (LigB family)
MLRETKPDVVIYPTTDHFTNFSSGNMPQFCIGVADSYYGPKEDFKTVPKGNVPGDPGLGKELVGMYLENGFDPASSTDLLLDHGTITPVQFMTPDWDIPIIPIFVNIAVPPLPSLRRCYDFGRTLAQQFADHPKRIAVVGTGGLSHDPATGRIWHLTEEFDRKFLDVVLAEGDPPLELMTPEDFALGGAGSHEVMTWVMARGVAGETGGHLIHYEAVEGWSTGMAVVRFE